MPSPMRPRVALLMVAGLVLCLAAACSQDDGTSETTSAAKPATPSPAPTRARQLLEGLKVNTPRPVLGDVDGAAQRTPAVYVSTNGDPDSGGAPLTVTFTAEVTGGPQGLHYRWDFGDNSMPGHQLEVQHTYQEPGDYTATFTVTGPGILETDEVSIEVTEEGIDVSIDADPDIGSVPLTVQFSAILDDDLPGPFYYQWDFGDGGRDVSNPTTHTYRDAGEYTARVTVTNSAGQIGRQDVEITVDPRENDAGQQ